ncbi:MAG: glycoside hydrolase family 172 protein [Capsulimonadales bacterium]|nr:glycoside hydrolase family 172 protein [Capsulimonadales bacterium]
MNEPLYRSPGKIRTRWASPENPTAQPGQGGRANGGRKGRAWLVVAAGETVTLAQEPEGVSGTVRRLWMTVNDRSPEMLRSLRVDFTWDGAASPAVSAPLGDFFGLGLGQCVAFHSALFANPEGRSFNAAIPMPFRNGMRLTLTNESDRQLDYLFYDVNYTIDDEHPDDTLYFHACFRRENPTVLQQDYALLPTVTGRGRFLGVNVGMRADVRRYHENWWGEGEVKMYLDGADLTLCGTGTEDYIGTAWGQGAFAHPYQGCPFADHARMAYCFYRYHVPDPVYFATSIRVTIQQLGGVFGDAKARLRERVEADGDPIYAAGPGLVPADLSENAPPFVMFERQDDWSSCAYFYLDRPENGLPPLMSVAERTKELPATRPAG